jgi:protein involved in polysaccharide export with SLBB domain
MKTNSWTSQAFVIAMFVGTAVLSGCASSSSIKESSDAGSQDNSANASAPARAAPGTGTSDSIIEDSVQPGYLFEVSNINDAGLNGKFRVEFDGKLKLPYGVVLNAAGLRVTEVRAKVVEAYRPFLKSAESVQVQLVQRKLWVDIRGLVNKPGRYLIEPEASLDEVLSAAFSLIANAQAEYIKIQSKTGTIAVSLTDYYDSGSTNGIPRWQGGELLFVQRKSEIASSLLSSSHPVIQVLGEVKTPGDLSFRRDADFLFYLAKAGGPTSVANLGKIEVVRWQDGKRKSTLYDWEESRELVRLDAGDLIIVHANQQTPLERAIQSGAGIGAMLSAIGILIIAL